MTIKKTAVAGTLESSDCLITLEPSDSLEIQLESTVKDLFGQDIIDCVTKTLKEFGIDAARVSVQDKGAFDSTIAARVECAVRRAQKED